MQREILHCDLNNFYASVECLYNPRIRELPVAVCGSVELRHGIVLAKNMAAKACGVKTGEPVWAAKRKCANLVVVPPNRERYLSMSASARAIYERHSGFVESFGIDECWLDVTGSPEPGGGEQIAERIRREIREELGITVSVGVSYNKIFAKMGSDYKKPDAVTVITRQNYRELLWPLPVRELLFVGRATESKLHTMGLYTIGQLAGCDPAYLMHRLGKNGYMLWLFSNGRDESAVMPSDYVDEPKSVGNSMTLPQDITSRREAEVTLTLLADSVAKRLRRARKVARIIQVSVKDNELFSREYESLLPEPSASAAALTACAAGLFGARYQWERPVRAMGLRAVELLDEDTPVQLDLEQYARSQLRQAKIERSMDEIRRRFGVRAITRGCLLDGSVTGTISPADDNIVHPVAFRKR